MMGVKKLWSLLDSVGKPVKISDLRGHRVAIDLSYWIVEMSQITNGQRKKMPSLKLHIKSLFWRCYHMLRNHVQPIFVIDGVSPSVKGKTIEARKTAMGVKLPSPIRKNKCNYRRMSECKELLDCLGIPYVVSAGEAEALCAKLDQDGFVDGCITDDTDAFLYGANTVYKNFSFRKQKVSCMRVYQSTFIEEKLGLNREKLIAMALLLGSDYTEGAKNIGPETTMKLLGKDGALMNTNVLGRMRSWREDPEGKFSKFEQFQRLPKPTHCSKCNHKGTVTKHKANGCVKCGTMKNCNETETSCDCEYHEKLQEISEHSIEIRVRRWAIEDPTFPPEEVIKEYLEPTCDPVGGLQQVKWKRPDIGKLQKYLINVLNFLELEANQKINELLVSWDLTHLTQHKNALQCKRVMKSRIQNSTPVLEVLWEDQGFGVQNLITIEDRETIAKHFPMAVESFDRETNVKAQLKKKLSTLSKHHKKITDFFKSKKKTPFNKGKRTTNCLYTDSSISCSSCTLASSSVTGSVQPVICTRSVQAHTTSGTFTQLSASLSFMNAEHLVDGSSEDVWQIQCSPPADCHHKNISEEKSGKGDKYFVEERKDKKRKSDSLDKARRTKKLKLCALQSNIVD